MKNRSQKSGSFIFMTPICPFLMIQLFAKGADNPSQNGPSPFIFPNFRIHTN
jgi:hypothetical protein